MGYFLTHRKSPFIFYLFERGDFVTTIYYTVEPGNTLWGIAQYFGTNVNDLARINNIAPPYTIFPGQNIRIPGDSLIPPRWYVIRPGDSLWNISQRYGVPFSDLINNNNFDDPNTIYPGQLIRLQP